MDINQYKEMKAGLETRLKEKLTKMIGTQVTVSFSDSLEEVTMTVRQEQRIENKIDVVNSSFNFSVATENNLTFSGYSQTLIIEKEMIRGTSTREIKTDLQTMTLLQQALRNFFLVEGLIVAPKPEEEIKTQPIEEVQTEETPS